MTVPRVSILVTVFNRAAYLAETLQSVLASSFQDFEVVVVDDHSSDGSLEIATQFARLDQRVRVYVNDKNLGDYPNRNRAASLACGQYFKYLDSDDLIYAHSLDIMVEAMEAHPDAVLGLCHSQPEAEQPYPWALTPEQTYRKHFLGRGCLGCGPSGSIIRRDAFMDAGGFRPEWAVLSDTDLWYRLSARNSIVLMPPGLVWWRRHDGQEFSRDQSELVYLQRGYELSIQALRAPECPLAEEQRAASVGRARQHFARNLWSLALVAHRPAEALRLFRASDLGIKEALRGLGSYQ